MESQIPEQRVSEQPSSFPVPDFNDMGMDASTLMWQLDSSDIIQEIEMNLKCQRYNTKGELVRFGQPLMNNMGVDTCLNLLRAVLTKNTYLSNAKENLINKVIVSFANDLICVVGTRWMEFEINKLNRDMVVDMLVANIAFALKRPQDEGERRFLKPTRKVIESINVQKQDNANPLNIFGRTK